ncbi:MAG TPA: hypothetical protein VN780_01040 [Candidatus Eisenbacteria bacterium]|nr:hypothetical protein [Candidatus Eisenbacteria bacterium]
MQESFRAPLLGCYCVFVAFASLRRYRTASDSTTSGNLEAQEYAHEHIYLVHVVISLIGILSGIVVLLGFLSAKRLDGWNAILITIVLTIVAAIKFRPEALVAAT